VFTRETLARVFGVQAEIRLDPTGRPLVDILDTIGRTS